ncbi:MAG: sigma 54-interacting transcriptional regulator [Parabacteroides sp.]|nr:sigma 54-interacting transcriptional regulator [Parabacteroides sp.]
MINKTFFLDHQEEILALLNSLKVGVYITDGEGNTLLVNDESCRTGGLSREEVMGKNMHELEQSGFVKKSITLKTLASQKGETMLQDLGDGGVVYTTSYPIFKEGKIDLVVTTERDITEMEHLRKLLKEKEQDTERYAEEIEYLIKSNMALTGDLIAIDVESQKLVKSVLRVAKLDTTVLILGESGTGKEVVANLIYKNSSRVGKPFIKVSCAAISENLIESEFFGYVKGAFTGADVAGKRGFFELANSGTIFLDEIGEIPLHLQSKFLRVMQEREVMRVGGSTPIPLDIRVLAATKIDLRDAVEKGTFREDLYYRLNVVPIEIKPLRTRKQDIGALAEHFVKEGNKRYRLNKHLTLEAIESLEKYSWPGNVRELKNVIERCVISFDGNEITRFQVERILYPKVDTDDVFKNEKDSVLNLKQRLEEYERMIIHDALKKYKNASHVAKALKIDKATLSRRITKYKLK